MKDDVEWVKWQPSSSNKTFINHHKVSYELTKKLFNRFKVTNGFKIKI